MAGEKVKTKGIDPLVCEDMLLNTIGLSVTVGNANTLRFAAGVLLLDAYDRKVTREAFADMLTVYASVSQHLTKAETLSAVFAAHKDGELSGDDLEAGVNEALRRGTIAVDAAVRALESLKLCATKEDTIN